MRKIRLVAALQNEAAAYRGNNRTTVIIGQDNRQEETNDIDQMRAQLESLLSAAIH